MVGLREKPKCPFYERGYCRFAELGNRNDRAKLGCPEEYKKDFTKCPHYKEHKEKLKKQIKKI